MLNILECPNSYLINMGNYFAFYSKEDLSYYRSSCREEFINLAACCPGVNLKYDRRRGKVIASPFVEGGQFNRLKGGNIISLLEIVPDWEQFDEDDTKMYFRRTRRNYSELAILPINVYDGTPLQKTVLRDAPYWVLTSCSYWEEEEEGTALITDLQIN